MSRFYSGFFFFVYIIVPFTIMLTGCGNSGSHTGMPTVHQVGTVLCTVSWPQRTRAGERFIPQAANSIVIKLDNGAGFTASQTVIRPANGSDVVVTFTAVPVCSVAVLANAYASTDGSGIAQAVATTTVQVADRQTTPITLDLGSTITSVSFDQYPNSFDTTQTAQLLVTARGAGNHVVPVRPQPNGFFWTTSNPVIATIDQNGLVTAVTAGTFTVIVMESETGITGSKTITVTTP